jgi:biopolymer transport protein ExbB
MIKPGETNRIFSRKTENPMIKTSSLQFQAQSRRRFFLLSLLLTVIGFLFYSVPDLLAQAADAAVEGEEEEAATMFDNVKQAGLWMVPLILASIAMVALIVYNFIQLTAAKFKPEDLKMALLDHMANCRVRSAIEVASTSPTYLGRMLASALPHVDATDPETLGREEVEDAVAEFTIRENRAHMNWIGYLGVIGQIAPMLGLLGTVVGMMGAFNTIGSQGQADPSALAADIGLAMVTTASGLIIAIPSVFFFFFLRNRFNGLVAACHQDMSDMLDASYQAVNAEQAMAKVPEGLQA